MLERVWASFLQYFLIFRLGLQKYWKKHAKSGPRAPKMNPKCEPRSIKSVKNKSIENACKNGCKK